VRPNFEPRQPIIERNGLQQRTESKGNVISDFFRSHPYTRLRKNKFQACARNWTDQHPSKKMYIGMKNLAEKQSRFERRYEDERTACRNPTPKGVGLGKIFYLCGKRL